ncbi:MAG TPA: SiaB family protein kinase [Flavobacteriales bacterium]|nr:SiaB family protein kinase [Flavobacteriales bacterium]
MMDLASVHALYDVLARDRFDLLYSGNFPDEHTADLITLSEDQAVLGLRDRTHRQRLAFVMVEAYQNIVRHRTKLIGAMERGAGRSMFMMRSTADGEEVIALDPVLTEEVEELDRMLARIGTADVKQLKQIFLDRLKDGTRTQRGGAGLGLIEMARRSNNGLRHKLLPLNASSKLFLLHVLVGQGMQETSADEVMRVHTLVGANEILLLCRGGASATVLDVVLNMLGKDIDTERGASDKLKRVYLAAAEWLQAVGVSDTSFIAVGGIDHKELIAGGCMPKDRVGAIREQVVRVKAMDANTRERHYRSAILGRGAMDLPTGLLDLARSSELDLADFEVPEGSRLLVRAKVL